MMTLEVEFVKLAECVGSPGWRLTMAATNAPGIHYDLIGMGRMIIGNHPPIDLQPHTLVIIPAGQSFCIEVAVDKRHPVTLTIAEENARTFAPGALRRFDAGSGEPEVILICGYFRATYGASIDLFRTLTSPIVEHFSATDQLDHRLSSAMGELVAQEVGTGAMTAALMKQVLVTLLRRSLTTKNLWVERFSMLGDPQIARAFAEMVTHPELPHSVESLTQTAGLSRSVFMAGFTRLPQAQAYQLWAVRDGVWLRIGICNTNEQGGWMGDFEFSVRAGEQIALTIEPAKGSEKPTSEPLLASNF